MGRQLPYPQAELSSGRIGDGSRDGIDTEARVLLLADPRPQCASEESSRRSDACSFVQLKLRRSNYVRQPTCRTVTLRAKVECSSRKEMDRGLPVRDRRSAVAGRSADRITRLIASMTATSRSCLESVEAMYYELARGHRGRAVNHSAELPVASDGRRLSPGGGVAARPREPSRWGATRMRAGHS